MWRLRYFSTWQWKIPWYHVGFIWFYHYCSGKIIYKCGTVHCHLWLPEGTCVWTRWRRTCQRIAILIRMLKPSDEVNSSSFTPIGLGRSHVQTPFLGDWNWETINERFPFQAVGGWIWPTFSPAGEAISYLKQLVESQHECQLLGLGLPHSRIAGQRWQGISHFPTGGFDWFQHVPTPHLWLGDFDKRCWSCRVVLESRHFTDLFSIAEWSEWCFQMSFMYVYSASELWW